MCFFSSHVGCGQRPCYDVVEERARGKKRKREEEQEEEEQEEHLVHWGFEWGVCRELCAGSVWVLVASCSSTNPIMHSRQHQRLLLLLLLLSPPN